MSSELTVISRGSGSGGTHPTAAGRPQLEVQRQQIAVELGPLPPAEELALEWRDLEERSDGSFFLSWSWIGCWIDSLGDAVDLRLLRARIRGSTVGLAIFAAHTERRHGIVVSRTLRLHATGRPELDALMVECNGFLTERGVSEAVQLRMMEWLSAQKRLWDELVLQGLWAMPSWPLERWRLRLSDVFESANYFVDLAAVRAHADGYLALLGSKSRANIRRSRKEYERLGELLVETPADCVQALEFLEGLKELHQRHWTARGELGSFANPFFEGFHRRLIRNAFGRGEIQLVAVNAGDRLLGYIYNFVYRGRIYNYQSGLDYQVCEKHNRPGLVAHASAIEYNARCGHSIYDFLAGNVEYKQALGTGQATMYWVVLQRHRLRFEIEAAARALRNRLYRSRPAPPR